MHAARDMEDMGTLVHVGFFSSIATSRIKGILIFERVALESVQVDAC